MIEIRAGELDIIGICVFFLYCRDIAKMPPVQSAETAFRLLEINGIAATGDKNNPLLTVGNGSTARVILRKYTENIVDRCIELHKGIMGQEVILEKPVTLDVVNRIHTGFLNRLYTMIIEDSLKSEYCRNLTVKEFAGFIFLIEYQN